jgi:hypothetical protein
MKEGDLLHIKGQNDDGTISTWYGELVGIDAEGNLELFYLEQTPLCGGYIWSYKSEWDTVSPDTVMQTFTPTKENYLSTLREFGFHATVEENQFLRVTDEIPATITVPMILDSDTESVHEGDSDLSDFIVDDDVANEPFTHACPSSDFVRETHQAVNDYNKWVPKSVEETRVKQFIDNMAQRYQTEDDNRHFANGEHVDYLHPRVSQ